MLQNTDTHTYTYIHMHVELSTPLFIRQGLKRVRLHSRLPAAVSNGDDSRIPALTMMYVPRVRNETSSRRPEHSGT